MKEISIKYPGNFEKTSMRSAEEIKKRCELLERDAIDGYTVKHNGNHIWLESAQEKSYFWTPVLHLELRTRNQQTFVRGEWVSPMVWVVSLLLRTVAVTILIGAFLLMYLKVAQGRAFGMEMIAVFAAASLWFGLYLFALWNQNRASRKISEFDGLLDGLLN